MYQSPGFTRIHSASGRSHQHKSPRKTPSGRLLAATQSAMCSAASDGEDSVTAPLSPTSPDTVIGLPRGPLDEKQEPSSVKCTRSRRCTLAPVREDGPPAVTGNVSAVLDRVSSPVARRPAAQPAAERAFIFSSSGANSFGPQSARRIGVRPPSHAACDADLPVGALYCARIDDSPSMRRSAPLMVRASSFCLPQD